MAECSTTLPSCVEASGQGLGRAQPSLISTVLRARRMFLNIKWYTYILKKTFIQTFSSFFLKISGRAAWSFCPPAFADKPPLVRSHKRNGLCGTARCRWENSITKHVDELGARFHWDKYWHQQWAFVNKGWNLQVRNRRWVYSPAECLSTTQGLFSMDLMMQPYGSVNYFWYTHLLSTFSNSLTKDKWLYVMSSIHKR
jgi:hypothetical protein